MSCECKKLIEGLLTKGQRMEIKIHDAEGAILRHELEVMEIMNDMSDNLVTKAWQMRQIAEIEVRIARRHAQIARFEAEIAEIERDVVEALKTVTRCVMDKAKLDNIFGGANPRFRVVNLEDLDGASDLADILNGLKNFGRRPNRGADTEDADSGLIGDVESVFAGMRH